MSTRVSPEKAREIVASVTERAEKNDSIITISSYGDDESVLVSNTSSEVFEELTPNSANTTDVITISDSSFEATPDKVVTTASVSDEKDATVFTFDGLERIKQDYNASGKRFERATGYRVVKNNPVELKPVSKMY